MVFKHLFGAVGLMATALGASGEPAPSYLDRHCAGLAAAPQPSIQELVDRLSAPDEDTRSGAADDLACRGAESGPAVPHMIRLFASKYGEIQANAVAAVTRLKAVAVPALIQAFDSSDSRVRNNTCRALKGIGSAAHAALPALKERLGRDGYDRALVGMAIKAIEQP